MMRIDVTSNLLVLILLIIFLPKLVVAQEPSVVTPQQDQPSDTTPMDHDSMPGMNHDTTTDGAMNSKSTDNTTAAQPQKDSADKKQNVQPELAPSIKPQDTMQNMDHDQMPGMDHSTVQPSQESMPGMDHSDHNMDNMPAMDHSSHNMDNMQNMDHSSMSGMNMDNGEMSMDMDMNMQGGSAPANARDPNAYSDGYTFDSGPYTLPGPRQLRMADEHNFASLLVDRLEDARTSNDTYTVYDIQAGYGRDYDKAVLKAEGEYDDWKLQESRAELLWSHAVSTYWNSQLGLRYDTGDEGPERSWFAIGVQGLAPYWFEMDITAYLGENGRSALSIETEYDILLTQKLILQPRIEAQAYGKDDIERGIGAGLAEAALGIRLRYELWRELAPYIGIEWAGKYGTTADIASDAGENPWQTRAIAGMRLWF